MSESMKLSFNAFNPDVLLSEPSQARNLKKVFSRDSSFPQDMPIEQKQISLLSDLKDLCHEI